MDSGSVNERHADDRELVRRVLARDAAAGDEFARRMQCVGRMVTARHRELGSQLDAQELEDVVQAVVTRVVEKLAEYAGIGALETWVYVFCEGELRNAIRRRIRRDRRSAPEAEQALARIAVDPPPDPDEDVHLCVAALPDRDRQLVRWKHHEGNTLDEISGKLAAKLNTVKGRYFRILTQLKRCLERRARGGRP